MIKTNNYIVRLVLKMIFQAATDKSFVVFL